MVAPVEENDRIVTGGPHGSLLGEGRPALAAATWASDPSVAAWLHGPAAAGFDAVLDLSDRPWNVRNVQQVLGVFRTGEPMAAYLVAGNEEGWVVLGMQSGWSVRHAITLSGALAQIPS